MINFHLNALFLKQVMFTQITGQWKSTVNGNSGSITMNIPHHSLIYKKYNFETSVMIDTNANENPYARILKLTGIADNSFYGTSYTFNSINSIDLSIFIQFTASGNKIVGTYCTNEPSDCGNVSFTYDVTCQGCIDNQPNQMAHYGDGGCLSIE
jgi:hypothetical protein